MINRTSFALLALGAVLFSAVFYVATKYQVLGWPVDSGSGEEGTDPRILIALYTIAFGLPYALWELTRRINVLTLLFLIILVPLVHYGAIYAFLYWTAEGQDIGTSENITLVAGLIAGFAGAAVSFALLFLLGLRTAGAGILVFFAGLLLLTAWGGIGMKLLPETPEPMDVILRLFLPWQIIFAFFLSALLKASPQRGAVTTTA